LACSSAPRLRQANRAKSLWVKRSEYPLIAPRPWLRVDFPQNLPHINPRKPGSKVSPCIAEMSLDELLHSNGFNGVLTAMGQWLDKAAANELHCPVQGWETVRRTDSQGEVMADTHAIRDELSKNNRTVRYYGAKYIIHKNFDGPILGAIETPSLGSDNKSYQSKDSYVYDPRGLRILHAPCVMFQTKPKASFDDYRPETVFDFGSLREFANYLGLKEAFEKRIQYLISIVSPDVKRKKNREPIEDFLVIFAVKRPFNLIGLDSNWELLSYWVRFSLIPGKEPLPENALVRPVQLVERSCTHLLQSVSGRSEDKPYRVAALGCGSLGSKIVLHLGKSGRYQFDLVDKAGFKSHNNARHGLVVQDFDLLSFSKAILLERELTRLNVRTKAIWKDICALNKENGFTLNKGVEYLIDSTASLKVRYFLSHKCSKLPGQLIHSVMFAKASMGVVAIEGKHRSVRVDDIMAILNSLCIHKNVYQLAMYGKDGPKLHHYGEGCSSVTTTMSDVEISLMSSAIASKIDTHISSSAQTESGVLHVGVLDKGTLNLTWEQHSLPPTLIILRDEQFPWEIRVLGTVSEQIKTLSLKDASVENGGVIAGQVCALSKTIYVNTLLDAP